MKIVFCLVNFCFGFIQWTLCTYHFIIVLSRGTDRLERDTVLGSWGSGSPMRIQNSGCHYAEAAILALQTRGF